MSSDNLKLVFISYAHEDIKYLQRLQIHLTPFEQNNAISFWDDTRISPGKKWLSEIKEAIATAKVAILLVSADFLASKFITEMELPALLGAAEKEGALILPVIISPCNFEFSKLSEFEAVNSPSLPLNKMTKPRREEEWARLAKIVYKILSSQLVFAHEKKIAPAKLVQVGEKLWDQYEVTKIVRMTAHNINVKCWDPPLNRFVSIKLLAPYQDDEDEHVKQLQQFLLREARILIDLEHKNIAKIYYIRTNPPAIIMRWIEGQTLNEYLVEDVPMAPVTVIKLGIGIADALNYIHQKNITHRNIKPNAIFLDESGEPILADFEIASSEELSAITSREYGGVVFVGSVAYSAPEQFEQPELVGPPADIFSLGVVLYELLTKNRPYRYGNNPQNYRGNFPQPDKYDIPDPLYHFLSQMLQQELSQRPPAALVRKRLHLLLSMFEK